MSATFSANKGSLLSLKVRNKCGFKPCFFQIRLTDASLRGAVLGGANLTGVTIAGTDFLAADLVSARLVAPIGLEAAKNFDKAQNVQRLLRE